MKKPKTNQKPKVASNKETKPKQTKTVKSHLGLDKGFITAWY